ncbi:PQQ-dependent sugar dehydrogenase [Iamia sp.]|uniref:PQQ-dependent sugar dehydrogenase n=1 Tax=Iamia sp. TaxID=2722710 RepID=UPI002BE78F48|nr:PQQ-dependent sugar dehydrogenase [Iamia sp.]HXH58671.1 PQQ-dependent sugar dehydrogenase [Iamia sp.]
MAVARGAVSRVAGSLLVLTLGAAALTACEPAPPTLEATTIVDGLVGPWDLTFTPSGSMIWTEKDGRIMIRRRTGQVLQLRADMSDLWVKYTTGLMGIVVDPNFNSNRRIYTCQGFQRTGGVRNVRVIRWEANAEGTALTRVGWPVVSIPSTSGNHSGCRLRFDHQRRLYVGTGDAITGTAPQDKTSLAGKVLRVNPDTGYGDPANPFHWSSVADKRKVFSYGHRNVQGLAFRASDRTMWSAEHGTGTDDEVNLEQPGGNYGWDPSRPPPYNENVPMTDTARYPDAVIPRWESGAPTIATSGITWLEGPQWKGWNGYLVAATLKGQSLALFRPEANGTMTLVERLYQNEWGRIRTVQQGPDGALYLTTSNNGTGERIIRLNPN